MPEAIDRDLVYEPCCFPFGNSRVGGPPIFEPKNPPVIWHVSTETPT